MLKLAFACALIGILALFVFSRLLDFEERSIREIVDKQMLGKFKIVGEISSVRSVDGARFLTLSQTCSVDAVLFMDALDAPLSEGLRVEAIGEKQGDLMVITRLRIIGNS